MGTKRHMVSEVREALTSLRANGRAIDLFSGMGSVAESLSSSDLSVITNDALSFTACISRAKFTGIERVDSAASLVASLTAHYQLAKDLLLQTFAEQIHRERCALAGDRDEVVLYMTSAKHVAGSASARDSAGIAKATSGVAHYRLASLYFSAGYISLEQAIEVDALRFAIDAEVEDASRDWALAAWIAAVSVLLNAPGHTAQHLWPNSEAAHRRIVRTWRRSIWDEFALALERIQLIGTSAWRARNEVRVSDALELVGSDQLEDVGVVYADPPYTKDQYSRFYHLYETLYRYDYPDAVGAGRVRSDRFSTGFSLKSQVRSAFHDLCRSVARKGIPLVVSYPSNGLLQQTGTTPDAIARQYFSQVTIDSIEARHSTMGASPGSSKKVATENLYVFT
ncbi:DNA adenine methylase [Microbacterium lacticum]|uniref:DNA adenine methylase n=1 Tax=Microbacterium lacticum TaxID=33885 RepID=UPI001F5925B8|nr:DNA adenine methylase [Microbacterium lacticum]